MKVVFITHGITKNNDGSVYFKGYFEDLSETWSLWVIGWDALYSVDYVDNMAGWPFPAPRNELNLN